MVHGSATATSIATAREKRQLSRCSDCRCYQPAAAVTWPGRAGPRWSLGLNERINHAEMAECRVAAGIRVFGRSTLANRGPGCLRCHRNRHRSC